MKEQNLTLTFDFTVKIAVPKDGFSHIKTAQGGFKKTIIANRTPVRAIQCRGVFKIDAFGASFVPDTSYDTVRQTGVGQL